jgi:hypothetical protein
MNDGPLGGENYSVLVSINLTVNDFENDSFAVAMRLVNENFSIDLGDCAIVLHNASEILCEVNISRDLILYPILRHDWSFEIIAADSNSSIWTEAKITTFRTGNFTLWWNNPVLEEPGLPLPIEKSGAGEFNRVLFWGISGVVVGAIMAASVMFRRFEVAALDSPLPPFREEE